MSGKGDLNNAAVAWLGARVGSDTYDAEKMNQQWAINTLGVVATIRAAAKILSNGGRTISISSGLGTRTTAPGISDYAGTKAAHAAWRSREASVCLSGRCTTLGEPFRSSSKTPGTMMTA